MYAFSDYEKSFLALASALIWQRQRKRQLNRLAHIHATVAAAASAASNKCAMQTKRKLIVPLSLCTRDIFLWFSLLVSESQSTAKNWTFVLRYVLWNFGFYSIFHQYMLHIVWFHKVFLRAAICEREILCTPIAITATTAAAKWLSSSGDMRTITFCHLNGISTFFNVLVSTFIL